MSEPTPDDVEVLNSYTPSGLYKFLDLAMKRGDLTQATGTALRVGSKKVLDIEDNDALDLRTVDLDDLVGRFKVLTRGDLNDKSQATYDGRVRKAVDMYVKFVNGDSSWKQHASKGSPTKPKKSGSTKSSNGTTPPREETPETNGTAHTPTPPPSKVQTVTVPVPLRRDGTQATVILPMDVTEREVKKVAQIIELYAMTEQLAITSGDTTE